MIRLEGSGEGLTAQKLKVIGDGESASFMMEMFEQSCGVTSGDDAEAMILHILELGDVRRLEVRRVDGAA